MDKAKVFWSGRSQAVRLPKEYRFNTGEVRIRRHGASVILEPIADDWTFLQAVAGTFGSDFMPEGRQEPAMQERAELDELFR
jgi:antitoxin VapB